MVTFRPLVSIVITTRNRKDNALSAVSSCFAQDYSGLEVLVFDDASEDGTDQAIRDAFPEARVLKNSERHGLVVNRNRGFAEAKGDFIFSLDDDSYFASRDIVKATIDTFEADPSIAAVAIPYVEPMQRRSLSNLRTPMRAAPLEELQGFVGCAHALRREAVVQMGGYREFFVHQGEERDLALRLRDAGWRIVYGPKGYVVHLISPNRDRGRIVFYGARNQILFDILNIPFPDLIFRVVWHIVAVIKHRFNWSMLGTKLRGIAAGFAVGLLRIGERRSVSRTIYRRSRTLPSHGPEAWEGQIPLPARARVVSVTRPR